MCQVASILRDVISELKAVPVSYYIPDDEFVGPLLGKGLKAKRSKSSKPKRESFNIDIPLWYKVIEENNASNSQYIISEPKTMQETNVTKTESNDNSTETIVTKKDPEATQDTQALIAQAIIEAEARGYNKGVTDQKALNQHQSLHERSTFMEGFKISSGLMLGITLVSIIGMGVTRALNNKFPEEKEVTEA